MCSEPAPTEKAEDGGGEGEETEDRRGLFDVAGFAKDSEGVEVGDAAGGGGGFDGDAELAELVEVGGHG